MFKRRNNDIDRRNASLDRVINGSLPLGEDILGSLLSEVSHMAYR